MSETNSISTPKATFFHTSEYATLYTNGRSYTISSDYEDFAEAVKACRSQNVDDFIAQFNKFEALKKYVAKATTNGEITITDDGIFYNGELLHNTLVDRIMELKRAKEPFEYMLEFLKNLYQNPSEDSRRELYDFLQHKNLPLTQDGCFICYKCVKDNYLDKYSGTYSNTPGAVISMPREQVDDNRNHECSRGLHVGALEYSGPNGWYYNQGDKVITVKVNPKDAVSVPRDHSAQKLRVSSYEVLGDYQFPLDKPVYRPENENPVSEQEDEWDEDEEDSWLEEYSDVEDESEVEEDEVESGEYVTANQLTDGRMYEFYSYAHRSYVKGTFQGRRDNRLVFNINGQETVFSYLDVNEFMTV